MEDLKLYLRLLEVRQIALEHSIQKIDPERFSEYQEELSRQIQQVAVEFPKAVDVIQNYLRKN